MSKRGFGPNEIPTTNHQLLPYTDFLQQVKNYDYKHSAIWLSCLDTLAFVLPKKFKLFGLFWRSL
jgi:hypothetical protein